jgi:hypothetical protein
LFVVGEMMFGAAWGSFKEDFSAIAVVEAMFKLLGWEK